MSQKEYPLQLKDWDKEFASFRAQAVKPTSKAQSTTLRKLTRILEDIGILRNRIHGQHIEILDHAGEREFLTDPKEKGLLYWSEQYAIMAEEHQLQCYQVKAMQFWIGLLDHLTGSPSNSNQVFRSFSRAESLKNRLQDIEQDQKDKLHQLKSQDAEYKTALSYMQKRRKPAKKLDAPLKVTDSLEPATVKLGGSQEISKQQNLSRLALQPVQAEKRAQTTAHPSEKPRIKSKSRVRSQRPIGGSLKTAPSAEAVLQKAKRLLEELDS